MSRQACCLKSSFFSRFPANLKSNTENLTGKDGKEHNLLELCEAYFNVKPNGNVDPSKDPHGELKNQNVLTNIDADNKKIVNNFGLENDKGLSEKMEEIRQILFAERQNRPRPHLDDKILTSWNGLMISGLAIAGMALHNQEYIGQAEKAAYFIKANMFDSKSGTLLRSIYTEGSGQVQQLKEPIHGFADDYAFLIQGLLDLYEATLNEAWIQWADELQAKQNQLFWDSVAFGFFTAPEGDSSIILRMKEEQDGAEPSANSISALNLLRLAAYTNNKSYQEMSGNIMKSYKTTLEKFPVAMPAMTCGLMMLEKSPLQIIISGPDNEKSQAMIDAVHSLLMPQKILIRSSDKKSFLAQKLDILKDIPVDQNKAYVCQNFTCSQPVGTPDELIKLIMKE